MKTTSLRRSSLYACAAVALVTTGAVAGNGVGGVFNLGQINNVSRTTELRGTTDTQQLLVRNNAAGGASSAVTGLSVQGIGVWGRSNRVGVRGTASATSGVTYGVYGSSASPSGYGGYFQNPSNAGVVALSGGRSLDDLNIGYAAAAGEFAGTNGVIGVGHTGGIGVAGISEGSGFGLWGIGGAAGVYASVTNSFGVAGDFVNLAPATDARQGRGIRARAAGAGLGLFPSSNYAGGGEFAGPDGVIGVSSGFGGTGVVGRAGNGAWAGNFFGNVGITGSLSKGSGSFKIDHPLDPANKYLSHSFVESPDMMNIYNGNVITDAEGVAVVELPDYFEALNREPRYQLTVIGSFADAQIAEKISDNRFTIRTEEPNVEVSWQVTGIRQDAFAEAHPVVVEEEKALADRGRYLHPVEHGEPETMGIGTHFAGQAGTDVPSVQ